MTTSSRPKYSKRNSTKDSRRSPRLGATVGIEIGYSTIYMVRLREAPDGTMLFHDCRTVEFDPNGGLESSSFNAVLKTALKEFCGSSSDLEIWAAPKLDRGRLHHIQTPRVNASRLSGAVYWALQREESFLEKESVVDFQVEEAAGAEKGASRNLNITGVLAAREDVESLQQAFSRAGYPLTGIALPLFALRNLVNLRSEETVKAPVLICKLGQLATSVSILLEGRLVFTRNIPLGLHSLAETLIKELEPAPSREEASNLIFKLGLEQEERSPDESQQHEEAFTLLGPILERMARQIERTIQYYQSNYDTEPIETIFLGGEIAARGRLFDFISEQLSANVVAIDPFDVPESPANDSLPATHAERVAYGPAFGLALEARQAGANLAHTYKERQNEGKHRKVATGVSIFLLLLITGAALFYSWQQSELRTLHAEQDALERSLTASGPRLTEAVIMAATEEVKALQERRRAAAKRYEGLALLSEITRITPENISLLHLSAEMGSVIEAERTLLLKGVVDGERTSLETSLTIYIARLDQSPLFHVVEVDSTELVEASGELYLTFTLEVETTEESKGVIAKK